MSGSVFQSESEVEVTNTVIKLATENFCTIKVQVVVDINRSNTDATSSDNIVHEIVEAEDNDIALAGLKEYVKDYCKHISAGRDQ